MATNRRDFLKGTAWMGAAAFAAGCMSKGGSVPAAGPGAMTTFAAKPLKKVRVGVAGLGNRGSMAVERISYIPGVEVAALCDVQPEKIAGCQKKLASSGRPAAKEYIGPEAYKAMCESDIDVVYNATCWDLHVPIALYAMRHGKHALTEVPSAFTVDECWELVETSEKTRMHCMQLENCCYGDTELLFLAMCRKGIIGELVHGEAAYIHDLRHMNYCDTDGKPGEFYWKHWRLRWNKEHKGNQYPTHGLGPVSQYMNINRGDRFDYLVSLESNQFNFEAYSKAKWPANNWHAQQKVQMGDMNTTLIKTALGRSIMVQHDVSSPRPYSRINTVTGTKGILADFPYRVGWEDEPGKGVHKFFSAEKAAEIRAKYRHPLWKMFGDIAKKVGGHGGMDFIMDLRWAYCLQNGLPLDMNVYDLASWCCLCELSEKSVRSKSAAKDIPDFTRGAWKTAKPLDIVTVDVDKMPGLDALLRKA